MEEEKTNFDKVVYLLCWMALGSVLTAVLFNIGGMMEASNATKACIAHVCSAYPSICECKGTECQVKAPPVDYYGDGNLSIGVMPLPQNNSN